MAQERKGKGGRQNQSDDNRKDSNSFESVIQIKRCAAVVKGGRRFSYNALVIVGDKQGRVGFGYSKAKEVSPAIAKASKVADRAMFKVRMVGKTIPHRVTGHFGACRVVLIPAAPGTGVIAGRGVRDIMVASGVHDILTKVFGSTNPINVIKATLEGLRRLRSRDQIAQLRGVVL